MNMAQPKMQVPDVAAQVSYAMRQMGVAPIPRNYELFYEAYIGSNPKLTKDLAALGSHATQEELDAIGAQYFSHNQSQGIRGCHGRIVNELEDLLTILKDEQATLENYNRLLHETQTRITSKSAASVDLLRNAIGVLSEATDTTMAQGKVTVEGVEAKSREMEDIRKELDEYKRIANTDSLTRLNALKQSLSLVINVAASVFFVATADVAWGAAAVMAVASLAGGTVGGRLASRIRPQSLRAAVVGTGLVIGTMYLVR